MQQQYIAGNNSNSPDDALAFEMQKDTARGSPHAYVKLRTSWMVQHRVKVLDLGLLAEDDVLLLQGLGEDANPRYTTI